MKLHKNDTQSLVDLDNVILWIPPPSFKRIGWILVVSFGHLIRYACHVINTATAHCHKPTGVLLHFFFFAK